MICSPLLAKQYTVRGQGIITCNRDGWDGVCVWGGGGVGETQFDPKSSTVLSEPKFGPPPHPPLKIPGSAPGLSFTIVRTYIPKTNLSFTTLTPSAAAASKF